MMPLEPLPLSCNFEGEVCSIEYNDYIYSSYAYGGWEVMKADWRPETTKPSVDSTLSRSGYHDYYVMTVSML